MQFNEVITRPVVLIEQQIAYYTVLILKFSNDTRISLERTNQVKL